MPFSLRLDGEVIASVDEQVTGVRVMTARGESSATGIAPHEGVVDIILDKVAPGGPPRLDQIEAQALQAIRDRSEEGQPVGYARDLLVNPKGLQATQGIHDETLRDGGVDPNVRQNHVVGGPSRDLGEGLSPKDTDVLTARIEAFGDHGDAQRAISDNPASGSFTAESGATSADSLSSPDDRRTPNQVYGGEGSTSQERGPSGDNADQTSGSSGPAAASGPQVGESEGPEAPSTSGGITVPKAGEKNKK
jgi:hypothetical protein